MNDYRLILRNARSDILLPRHTAEVHAEHLAWLTDRIARPHAGPTVIVTHHGPSPCATGPIDRLTPAFSSDLDGWILLHKPDLWLFGHTHRRLAGQVGHTRIMNISQGYPGEVPEGDETDILLRGLRVAGGREEGHGMMEDREPGAEAETLLRGLLEEDRP
jgi:hypothetical protein